MGVSLRKVAAIASTLRETFYQVEEKAGLPRRIEHLLWAAPCSRARVAQILSPHSATQVNRAIDRLIREGRVSEDTSARTPILAVTRGEARLVRSDWLSRLDGAENLLDNLGNTLADRFWGEGSMSLARTVNLAIRRRHLSKLQQFYETVLWPKLVSLDKASIGHEDAIDIDLSIFWAKSTLENQENRDDET
jgi:hypothetical protein